MHRTPPCRSAAVTTATTVLALLGSVVVGPVGPAAADPDMAEPCDGAVDAPFTDRDQVASTHRAAVDCLWGLGIVEGRVGADGHRRFLPAAAVTRGQFAAMLHGVLEAAGYQLDGSAPPPPADGVARFDDVPADHVFHPEVEVLAAAGVIEGVAPGRFEPSRPLRRDQATSLLVRSGAWLAGGELQPAAGPYFADITASVHRSSIEVAFEHGLVEGLRRPCGDGEGRFAGARLVERQQAASMLVRSFTALAAMRRGEPGTERADADCPAPVWRPDLTSAVAYGAERAGDVAIAAIGTDGAMVGSGSSRRVDAASVLKVMFLVAYLRQPDVRDRALTQADRDLLEPMIRRSANDPATTIANRLGPGPLERLAEQAGMRDFASTRPWGRSQTSARDQAAFMLEVDRYVAARHRAYVLELLTEVVPEQRWGIGAVDTGDWTPHFKGGWGAATGAVDHQVALLRHTDGTRVAVAVMVTDSPSHDHGTATLQGVVEQLLDDLP